MVKIVFFNGPPQVGKDTITSELMKIVPSAVHYKFSQPLKDCFRAFYGFMGPGVVEKMLEEYKDTVDKTFLGEWETARKFQIALSEDFVKPALGQDGFGKLALLRLRSNPIQQAFFSDSGFRDECLPIVKHYGGSSCYLVRVEREGKDFTGDSRSYIDNLPIPREHYHTFNNMFDKATEPDMFHGQVKRLWRKINE